MIPVRGAFALEESVARGDRIRSSTLRLVLIADRPDGLGSTSIVLYAGNLHENRNPVFCAGVVGAR